MTRKPVKIAVNRTILSTPGKLRMTREFSTLIPTVRTASVSPSVLDSAGAWNFLKKVTETGIVLDERRGLGTPRPVQPRRAMLLNGTNQYGTYSLREPIAQYPFTLFGWSNTPSDANSYLFNVSDSTAAARHIAFAPQRFANTAWLVRRNTTEFITSVTANDVVNEWVSWVVVFSSPTTVEIYKDGVLLQALTGLSSVSMSSGFNRFAVGSIQTAKRNQSTAILPRPTGRRVDSFVFPSHDRGQFVRDRR